MSEFYLYFHIPFCKSKCIYCDFISTTDTTLVEAYFNALRRDFYSWKDFLKDRRVKSVYFGGGTPSIVDVKYISNVLEWVSGVLNFAENVEITVEANPESVSLEFLRNLRTVGVNRLSLGIQAVDDIVLKLSRRVHDVYGARKAVCIVRDVFDNFNLDFVIGLPGYSFITVDNNIRFVEEFQPSHVSVYVLELHEETPLFNSVVSGEMELPENTHEFYTIFKDYLIKSGYEWYEISNFAYPGKRTVHNLAYWNNEDYLGFGVSAGGHVGRYRYVKTMDISEYIKNPFALSYENHNSSCKEFKETLFMGLRLIEGIDGSKLREAFGELYDRFVQDIEGDELFVVGNRLKLSDFGLDFSREAFEKIVRWDCGD